MPKKTDDNDLSPIERRGELRGFLHEVTVDLGDGVIAVVQEASPQGMFVSVDEPDKLTLGKVSRVILKCGGQEVTCRAELVRKEIAPRTGIAFRIEHISPDKEFEYRKILADAIKHRPDDLW